MCSSRAVTRRLRESAHLPSADGGVEDAGLEIRDVLLWLNAQGTPKAHKLPGGRAALLKPAYEPVLLARSPLTGTTPANVEEWGTGALNVEASRVNGYWPAHIAYSHENGCTETRCASDCPARPDRRGSAGSAPEPHVLCRQGVKARA